MSVPTTNDFDATRSRNSRLMISRTSRRCHLRQPRGDLGMANPLDKDLMQ